MARHRVFFSYTGADGAIVETLIAGLREEPEVECFAFEHDTLLGDNIVEEVRQRLHWCSYFVPVISKESLERPWLTFEINTAILRTFEKECIFIPMLRDVPSQDLSADLRQYNAITVDPSIDYVDCLTNRILSDDVTADERRWDLFRPLPRDLDLPVLLSWRIRSSVLHGRKKEFEELKQWADAEPAGVRVRIVSGPGGSGKTRLAAELAMDLWKSGWDTQFIRAGDPIPSALGIASLWIIDYPEEQPELTKFFREIRKFRGAHRVRILMLTRLPREWWLKHSSLRTAHARDLLGETFDLEVEELSVDDTLRLYHEVVDTIGRWFAKSAPAIADDKLLEWRSAEPEHRLPLYITALAIHMVSSNATKLDLSGAEIMRELVWRERERVDSYANGDSDSPEEWPSRVLGLAALTECLKGSSLKHLADEAFTLNLPPQSKVVDAVRKTPLWNVDAHGVLPLRPDIFAAAFLHEVLSAREDAAPEWLWATIEPELSSNPANLRDRIGRLIFDVEKICNAKESKLSQLLSRMVADNPMRARKLKNIANDDRPPEFLLPLLVDINFAVLAAGALSTEERVLTLRILGFQMARLKRDEEARKIFNEAVRLCESTNNKIDLSECLRGLSGVVEKSDVTGRIVAATRALDIQRELSVGKDVIRQGALARALNDYAIAIKGQIDENSKALSALEALEECVTIYQQLLDEAKPVERHVYEDNLARAFFNLASEQWNSEQHDAALESSSRSVEIRRSLYADYRWRYARYFAMSLSQFGEFSAAKNNAVDANVVAGQTVEIYTDLYKANPAQFGVDLAVAMGQQSSAAGIAGDRARATSLRQEQAEFVKNLLSEGRVARYSSILREITLELVAAGYNSAGNTELAVDVCTQAIDLLNAFRANEKQLWHVSLHYVLVGGYLNRGNAFKTESNQMAIADYSAGAEEAIFLKEECGFFSQSEVLRELCLLNRCIEFLKRGEITEASSDLHEVIACEESIRLEIPDQWPIQEHDQVLKSLSVLADYANKLSMEDASKISEFTVSVTHGLIAGGKLSAISTVDFLLKSGVDSVAKDRKLAADYLRDAVNAAKEIGEACFTDNHAAALFFNNTAYRIGLLVHVLEDEQSILYAVDIARGAVAVCTDREHKLWGQSRETLGFVSGLLHRFDPNRVVRDESKTAFRDAIAFFRQLGDDTAVQESIVDWIKVHGQYAEDQEKMNTRSTSP